MKELRAKYLALIHFQPYLKGQSVLVQPENFPAVYYMNKVGAYKVPLTEPGMQEDYVLGPSQYQECSTQWAKQMAPDQWGVQSNHWQMGKTHHRGHGHYHQCENLEILLLT